MAKQKPQLMVETVHDFPKDTKILALKLDEKLNDINANTFVPLILFNRDETVKLIKESKGDLERLVKVI